MGVNRIFKRKQGLLLVVMVATGLLFFFSFNVFYSKSQTQGLMDKLENGQKIRYLVLGDSIGRGSGAEKPELTWFSQLENMIHEKYGSKMNGQYIVQSGATSFEGIYKLQETKVSPYTDLIFIVFGENDRKYMLKDDFAELYENLIRHAKISAPQANVITVIESSLPDEGFAQIIKDISKHYGAVPVDMRPIFKQSPLSISELTKDSVHPNGKGYSLYANEIFNTLSTLDNEQKSVPLPKAKYIQNDYQLKMNDRYNHNYGFTKHNGYLHSNKEKSQLIYQFKGPIVGAVLLRGPDGGTADIYIDDQFHSTISTWWPFQKERYIYLANNLGEGTHELKIVPTGLQSKHNSTNASYIRISGILEKE
ncbi:SGNH/GDSL hydrolase family protein [Bacillus sp. E214]|uniref:SGNH/GDSL hydrolase family protein n=1 Tax=Bacillus sp. E214 TaxID=2587156 RepID=UPI0011DF7DE3|nr:SGNH/GDSL hydrolase family protein [Bacillus sp. E214]